MNNSVNTKLINDFIDSISKSGHPYKVIRNRRETVIIFEAWDHQPIINKQSGFKQYKELKSKSVKEKKP